MGWREGGGNRMLTIIHSQQATTKKEPKEIPYIFDKTALKMRKPRTKKKSSKVSELNNIMFITDRDSMKKNILMTNIEE